MMSSLICSNCDWYKGCECTNPDSHCYKMALGGHCSCGQFFPRLAIKPEDMKILEVKETVNHPNHYNVGGIEVIDFIESWNLGFSLGNAIKYIARAPYKNNELEDLKKAKWYINREIEKLEKNTNK